MPSTRLGERFGLAAKGLTLRAPQAVSFVDRARQAMDSREVIGTATGLLMHEHRLNQDAALEVLRRRAAAANRTVREVAAELVDEADETGLTLRPVADC